MAGKGGIISFRVGPDEMARIREKAKGMPRKANGRLPSSGDVAHRILHEALQQGVRREDTTLVDVIKAIDPAWSGNKPSVPKPEKVAGPGGNSPVELHLERQR